MGRCSGHRADQNAPHLQPLTIRSSRAFATSRADADRRGVILLDGEHLVAGSAATRPSRSTSSALAEQRRRSPCRRAWSIASHARARRSSRVTDHGAGGHEPGRSSPRASSRSRRAPAPASLDEVVAAAPAARRSCCSGIQDPGNVGAIVRAADACGATGVVAIEGTADPFGWKALRGAMGSTFRLPVAARQPLPRRRSASPTSRHVAIVATVPRRRHAAAGRATCAGRSRSCSAARAPGLPDDLVDGGRRARDHPDAPAGRIASTSPSRRR